jgi:hypothetical protein
VPRSRVAPGCLITLAFFALLAVFAAQSLPWVGGATGAAPERGMAADSEPRSYRLLNYLRSAIPA